MCTVLLPPGVNSIAVKYIISYHIISYHNISYHIISYISYHIISYHITSHHIVYHIILYHIISYHTVSYHIISYHIISHHTTSHHIISYIIYIAQQVQRLTSRLTVRGSNPGREKFLHTPLEWLWGLLSLLCNGYRVYFPAVMQPGCGVGQKPPTSTEFTERAQLYISYPGAFMARSRANFIFTI